MQVTRIPVHGQTALPIFTEIGRLFEIPDNRLQWLERSCRKILRIRLLSTPDRGVLPQSISDSNSGAALPP